jgi:hypothetical protein
MIRTSVRPAAILVAVIIVFLLPYFAGAQTETANISGVVKDQQGAVVREAKVTATRIETGTVASTTTDAGGAYHFTGLASGHFRIAVTKQGFKEVFTSDFTLGARTSAEQNITLLVGSASETIRVKAVPNSIVALDSSSATRTDTPLIEVPQAVATVTHELLVEQDVHTLADALKNVAGVVPTKPEEILFVTPLVRGFPAEIYTDGLSMFGNTTTANDPTSLVGAERIDVVKGPNSTMYGGGLGSPLGGLIDVVSVRAEPGLNGYVGIRGGNFETLDPNGDLNIPINARIAARLPGEYQRNDSWVDVVSGDRWSLQPAMSFQLGPKTDLFVQGRFNHRDQLEYSGIPGVQAFAGQVDRNAFAGAPVGQPHTRLESRMGTVDLNHTITDSLGWNTSARYYFSQANEHGSFILPGLSPPDPAPPVYQIFTLDITDRLGQGLRFADSPCGTFHRLRDIRLQLRVGDGVRLLRSRDTPQYLAINWIAENAPKAFDLARDSLIDGPTLHFRRPWTAGRVDLSGRRVSLRKRPVGKCGKPGRLPLLIEIDPGLRQVVKITAQAEAAGRSLKCLGFRRCHRVLFIRPLLPAS